MTHICPACEIGELVAREGASTIQYDGEPLVVRGIQFSHCPVCGEDVVLPEQSKINEVLFADAKKERDGLWSCAGISTFRNNWGISQQEAARLFGGGLNAFSKYERGEVLQSRSMDLLMRVFNEFSEVRTYLGRRAGIERWGDQDWQAVSEPCEDMMLRSHGRKSGKVVDMAAYQALVGELRAMAANNDAWMDEQMYASC